VSDDFFGPEEHRFYRDQLRLSPTRVELQMKIAELERSRHELSQKVWRERLKSSEQSIALLTVLLRANETSRAARQTEILQRLIDGIVWDWDNPYADPGDWVPLKE
jgi:hypothetical protein